MLIPMLIGGLVLSVMTNFMLWYYLCTASSDAEFYRSLAKEVLKYEN